MESVPLWLNIFFILIVGIIYSAIILGARYANNLTRAVSPAGILVFRAVVGGWVLMSGLLAMQGFFLDFSTAPPKIAAASFIFATGLAVFAFSPLATRWLSAISQTWIIGMQTFRLFVEVVLIGLARTPLLPKLMTVEGRNFDILIGLTAPILAWRIHKQSEPSRSKWALVAWNVLGIVSLLNVVVNGVLSAPTPMQQIFVEPPNTALGYFPYAWLPAFLVPVALFLHVLSLRKAGLRAESDR